MCKWKVPDGTRGHHKAYPESLDSEESTLGVKWEFHAETQGLGSSGVLEVNRGTLGDIKSPDCGVGIPGVKGGVPSNVRGQNFS